MIKLSEKHSPDFNALSFVAKAVPKKDTRYYLNYLYVMENSRAVGTDGHRIHLATQNTLEPGYYEIAKHTKTQLWLSAENVDARYPDVDRVTGDRPNGSTEWIDLGPALGRRDRAQFYAARDMGMCVNADYVADATSYPSAPKVAEGDGKLWIAYPNEPVEAAIMPMRV